MAELTKEEQIQAIYDLKVGYTLGHADISMLKSMARQLLASMEQEPEGWQFLGVNGLWVSVTENGMRQAMKEGCEVRTLYAAPQLPQPAVPEEIDVNDPALDTHRKWMVEGWNQCRAAMLQDGNHTEQHLDMVVHSGDDSEKADCRLPFDQWLSQQNEPIDVDCGCVTTEAFYHWLRVAYEAGNSPVIGIDLASEPDRSVEVRYLAPPGYVIVPIVPTEDMIINGFESVPDPHFSDEKECEEYEALSGCRQAARRAELCWAAMIKAAPKQENI